ncbi:DNA recombination protein RmuC [Caminibacter profundus]
MNMQSLYITNGVLAAIVVFLIVFLVVMKKKNDKLTKENEKKDELLNETNSKLQYQMTQNAILEEKIKNNEKDLQEFSVLKEKYEILLNEQKLLEVQKSELAQKVNDLEEIKVKYENVQKEFIENREEIKRLSTLIDETRKNLSQKEEELKKTIEELENLREVNTALKTENKKLQTYLEESQKAYEEKIEFIKKSEEKLKESFKNLANEILEQTNEKMTKASQTTLSQILNPLQHQMKEFRERIEFLSKEEASKISALENELKNLKDLSHKLSTDAENLAKALKGEKKTQGNWGELVLERVLELSGLRKGIEYEREVSLNDESNKRYRPDVIVHLPNDRDVIIDAKTSLNAYQEYINTEDKTYIKAHIQALKNHIDNLADKKYENLKGVHSLDFIFMFVPIENALLLALENDSSLFEYAFKKRVVLVSPTTLLVSLRAIESSWRFERQAKNIEEVVKTAENLYDKVRGFAEDFEKIGKSLESAQKTYENAKNKLTSGRGNVIRQIELLKQKSGIKPKKEISKDLVDVAMIENK